MGELDPQLAVSTVVHLSLLPLCLIAPLLSHRFVFGLLAQRAQAHFSCSSKLLLFCSLLTTCPHQLFIYHSSVSIRPPRPCLSHVTISYLAQMQCSALPTLFLISLASHQKYNSISISVSASPSHLGVNVGRVVPATHIAVIQSPLLSG